MTGRKIRIRLAALSVLLLVAVVPLSACGKRNEVMTFGKYTSDVESEAVPATVCENARWQLRWDDALKRVWFYDKQTGAMWGQMSEDAAAAQVQPDGSRKKYNPQMDSAVILTYYRSETFTSLSLYSVNSVPDDCVYTQKIENGLRVTYDFYEEEYTVPVEYTIGEEGFSVSVNPAEITEGDAAPGILHSISVAPFLCGVQNGAEDSWFFVPSGSGTLIRPAVISNVGELGGLSIYGRDRSIRLYGTSGTGKNATMPVYGMKKGDLAMLAVVSEGAQTASVSWSIGSTNIGYSTVYASFRMRGYEAITRPNEFVNLTTVGSFQVFDEGIYPGRLRVDYYPLSGSEANISGMARRYRSYLKQNGLSPLTGGEKKATFRLVGGVEQPDSILGIPSTKLFPLTTTEQAERMIRELTDTVGKEVNVQFTGFGKSGADPGQVAGGFTVARKLGGVKGMRALVSALDGIGVDSYMDFELISYSKSGSGFKKNSAVQYPSGKLAYYTSYSWVTGGKNSDRYYVLSRDGLLRAAEKTLKAADKMGLSGISYASLSNTSYSDYSEQKYFCRASMDTDTASVFTNARESGRKTLGAGANDYAVPYCDYLTDTPLYSDSYSISIADVPFYAMVFKGLRPMSSVSVNLCPDRTDALLRCAQSGIAPSFTLYNTYERELVSNPHTFIFGSRYDGIRDEVVDSVRSLEDLLNRVRDTEISEFSYLSDTVTRTVFANGTTVTVNFGDTEAKTEYGTVGAKDFLVGRSA